MSDPNTTKTHLKDPAVADQPPHESATGAIRRELTSAERAALEDIEAVYANFHAVLQRIEASSVRSAHAVGDEIEKARTKLLEASAWARRHVTG